MYWRVCSHTVYSAWLQSPVCRPSAFADPTPLDVHASCRCDRRVVVAHPRIQLLCSGHKQCSGGRTLASVPSHWKCHMLIWQLVRRCVQVVSHGHPPIGLENMRPQMLSEWAQLSFKEVSPPLGLLDRLLQVCTQETRPEQGFQLKLKPPQFRMTASQYAWNAVVSKQSAGGKSSVEKSVKTARTTSSIGKSVKTARTNSYGGKL